MDGEIFRGADGVAVNINAWVHMTQAGRIAGVSRRTVYNWLWKGLLTTRRTASGRTQVQVASLFREGRRA